MNRICKHPNCENLTEGTYRWCTSHRYRRVVLEDDAKCAIDGCNWAASIGKLCGLHNQRRKTGVRMDAPMRRANGSGTNWILSSDGYMVRKVKNKWIRQHREVMEQHLGRKLHEHENVHHINGDRTDNRIENLELWSTWQPCGQRVEDKIKWAKELLEQYAVL